MQVTSLSPDGKTQILTFSSQENENNSVRIERTFLLESFVEWKIFVEVQSSYDAFTELSEEEISADLSISYDAAMQLIKELPEEYQKLILEIGKEIVNDTTADTYIYQWVAKTIPGGEIDKLFLSNFK